MTDVARRILHLGNILNNGYLNSKFLRRRGWHADSVTVDYRHVQAQPEWEEVAIIDPALDHFNPDWSTIDLGGYQRVDWFHDVALADIGALAARIGPPEDAAGGERPEAAVVADAPPANTFTDVGRRVLARMGLSSLGRAARTQVRVMDERLSGPSIGQQLIADFAAAYPDRSDRLTLADIVDAKPRSIAHAPLFAQYPLVQAYSLDPIHVLVNNPAQPFICFEHGTMREFPFEDSARGRLYALALKKAERIFITNADCNRSAERLGLTHYTFVPHPVDEELYRPAPSPLGERLRREHGCDYIFVAPARHHWKHCPPGLENSWFKRNDILIRALGRFFASRPQCKALVVFFEWGQEVAFSKELIAACGFADRVRWEPIASKPVMREYYNAADIVFDQFNNGIGTFGTVVPEALASGKPVLLNYQEHLHHWCFPELPPALNAPDESAIEAHVVRLIDDPAYRLALGAKGRDWFLRNHSSSLVASRMIDVYLDIADRRGWRWRHATGGI
jgi:glycosyltransferase involved in cell wall biosynthesis